MIKEGIRPCSSNVLFAILFTLHNLDYNAACYMIQCVMLLERERRVISFALPDARAPPFFLGGGNIFPTGSIYH